MNGLRWWFAAAVVALVCSFGGRAHAHKPSDAYVTFDVADEMVHVRVDVALRDLAPVLELDRDADGILAWREVLPRAGEIDGYVRERVAMRTAAGPCPFATNAAPLSLVGHTDGTYAVLHFDAQCANDVRELTVDYHLLFDVDALHRGLLRVAGHEQSAIASADAPTVTMKLDGAPAASFAFAVREGVVHIAEGTDHLLFVFALLLPAVLRRKRDAAVWEPASSFKEALLDVARIITAFTLAHSITLSLAALEVVRVPSRLVETSIALSVAYAALANLKPAFGAPWLAAFALGLLHGFGFSSVLADLGLLRGGLVQALFGFNLGVELGQLAFVALVFPLAFALRRTRLYVPVGLRGVSVAIAAIAMIWAAERAFDLKIVS